LNIHNNNTNNKKHNMTQKSDGSNKLDMKQDDTNDGKGGIRFGTGVAYDDAYAGGSHNGDDEYVTSLPTLDEERQQFMSDHYDHVRGRELEELEDAGQVPSGGGRSSTWKVSVVVLVLCFVSFILMPQSNIHQSVSNINILIGIDS
jgi:hypothetical protein